MEQKEGLIKDILVGILIVAILIGWTFVALSY